MAYELHEGQGSLFKNNYKDKETKPDYKGTILINGQLYDVAAWLKQGQRGDAFYSLKAEPHQDRPAQQGAPAQRPAPAPQPTNSFDSPEYHEENPEDLPF